MRYTNKFKANPKKQNAKWMKQRKKKIERHEAQTANIEMKKENGI